MSGIVARMFTNMPLASPGNAGPARERRAAPRERQELELGAGLVLKDRSRAGACLMIRGLAPEPGTVFRFAAENVALAGRVRWVREAGDGVSLFGIETAVSD